MLSDLTFICSLSIAGQIDWHVWFTFRAWRTIAFGFQCVDFLRQQGVTRPCVSRFPYAIHHLIDGILDGVLHDVQLIDHIVMHGLIEHLLELCGVFGDGDVARRREVSLLDHLALSADQVECLKISIFETVDGLL